MPAPIHSGLDGDHSSQHGTYRHPIAIDLHRTRLSVLLGMDADELREKLGPGRRSVWISRHVDRSIGDRIRGLRDDLPGVGAMQDSKRVYPQGTLASQVLGLVDIDGNGIEGIEHTYDGDMAGRDGLVRLKMDGHGKVLPRTRRVLREPRNGATVYLTIDTDIQRITEAALARMAKVYRPQSACAIVLDPKTGEILALANSPAFDPNKPRPTNPAQWRNRAVYDLYEPGGTFKAITMAAGLGGGHIGAISDHDLHRPKEYPGQEH